MLGAILTALAQTSPSFGGASGFSSASGSPSSLAGLTGSGFSQSSASGATSGSAGGLGALGGGSSASGGLPSGVSPITLNAQGQPDWASWLLQGSANFPTGLQGLIPQIQQQDAGDTGLSSGIGVLDLASAIANYAGTGYGIGSGANYASLLSGGTIPSWAYPALYTLGTSQLPDLPAQYQNTPGAPGEYNALVFNSQPGQQLLSEGLYPWYGSQIQTYLANPFVAGNPDLSTANPAQNLLVQEAQAAFG